MPLRDVNVTITLNRPAGLLGFGKPLILTPATDAGGQPYREYAELAAVGLDYGAESDVYQAAAAVFGQGDYRPERVAIATYNGAAGIPAGLEPYYDRDWYFLLLTSNAIADKTAAADYIEANGRKVYAARVNSLDDLRTLQAGEYDRTFAFYHPDADTLYPEAALVGAVGARDVGSVTWKFKALNNVISLDDLTQTELNNIHDLNGITYVRKAGLPGTSEGWMLSGEFIDVIMSKDWIQVNIENTLQLALNRADKVPFTTAGISLLEGGTRSILQEGYNRGMIADDADGIPAFTTDFPTREETTAADRAARHLTGANFSFELAGAVHSAKITGAINY